MNRSCVAAIRTAASVMVITSASLTVAFGYEPGIRDDQIPYGIEGTIGRGTDYLDSSGRRRDGRGSDYLPISSNTNSVRTTSSIAPPRVIRSATRPYRTTQYYQPGTGTRYPIYYSPATRTYFYYLVPPR